MLQGLDHRAASAPPPARCSAARVIYVLDRFKLIHVPIDVYQISYVPFTLLPLDFRDRHARGARHLLRRDDLPVAPGGEARSRAGAQVPMIGIQCRIRCADGRSFDGLQRLTADRRRRASSKSYPVGSSTVDRAARPVARRSTRARWWRSSARPASARARCCTCSAGSTHRRRHRAHRRRRPARADAPTSVVAFRNRHVGFVFQFHHLLPEFSALENAGMPMRIARRAGGRARRPRDDAARTRRSCRAPRAPARHAVGRRAAARRDRARAGHEPTLLLADEPTGDLDEHTAESLHDLLREMHRERGLTSIIATHNPRLAAACDRVLRLEDGHLVAER